MNSTTTSRKMCGLDIESIYNLLLRRPIFKDIRLALPNTSNNTVCKILESTNSSLIQILLYGSTLFDRETSIFILDTTNDLIISAKRF